MAKLRVDLVVIAAAKLEEKIKVEEKIQKEPEERPEIVLQGRIISFDFAQGSGFINIGSTSGAEEDMLFEAIKDDKVVANLKIVTAFNNTSKFILFDTKPPEVPLEDLMVRLAKEKKIKESFIKRLWQKAKNKFSGKIKSVYTQYDIDGNFSKSFYRMGENYCEELDLRYNDRLNNGLDVEGFISTRWTDDKYVDPERYSIEELYGEATGERFLMRAGDITASFTNYSLLSSLKGIKSTIGIVNRFGQLNSEAIFGVNKSRWEDLWYDISRETYTRYVIGGRIFQDFGNSSILGINLVSTDDDKSGGAPPGTIPQDNKVLSVDLKTKIFDKLNITSEAAQSFTRLNETRPMENFKHDSAYNIDTNFDFAGFRIQNDYEMVGTNFRSLSGVATNDREEFNHQIQYSPDRKFSGGVGYRNFHDNLKKLLSYTTFNDVWTGNLSANPLSKLADFNISLGYDLLKRTSSDLSTSVDESTATYNLDLVNTTGVYNYGFGYSLIRKSDDITISNRRFKNIWDAFIRSTYQFEDIRLMPNIGYSFEKDKQRTTKDIDTYLAARAGCALYVAKHTSANFNYTYSITDYKQATTVDLTRNIYDVKLRHLLFNNPDRVAEASFKQNDYHKKDSFSSYTENIFELSYTHKF